MTQAGLWIAAGVCAAVAVVAGLAEWLRLRRRDLDRPGIAPWGLISVLGFLAALVAVAVAIKG